MGSSVREWRDELEQIERTNSMARRASDKIRIFRVVYTNYDTSENRWIIEKRANSYTGGTLRGKEREIASKNRIDDGLGGYRTKKQAVDRARKLAKYYAKNHEAGYVLIETKNGEFSGYSRYD